MSRSIPGLAFLGCLLVLGSASADDQQIAQDKAIAAIEVLGGHVWFESQWKGTGTPPLKNELDAKPSDKRTRGSVVAVTFDVEDYLEFDFGEAVARPLDPPIKDAELRWLESLPDVRWLSLTHTGVTDEGLARLGALKSLRTLKLCDTAVDDESMEQLSRLRRLTTIDVNRTKITAEGALKMLRALPGTVVLHESNPLLSIVTFAPPGDGPKELRVSQDRKLAWHVSLDKEKYAEGEPVLVTITVLNVGSETLNFPAPTLPNSPSGFLHARLNSSNVKVAFNSPAKGGGLVELKPKAAHTFHFALGEHAQPHFTEFTYDRSTHFLEISAPVKHLRPGVYRLQVQSSGRRYDPQGTNRVNQWLNERNVWGSSLATPSLTFSVLSDGKPQPGNRVESLTCQIKTERTKYKTGESIVVTRTLRNDSDQARPYHKYNLFSHWIDRQTGVRSLQGCYSCGAGGTLPEIPAGKSIKEQWTDKAKEAGEYDYSVSCPVPGSKERLISNTIHITIEP